MTPRTLPLASALLCALMLVPRPAAAQLPAASCSTGAISVGDTYLNPATRADKDFFSSPRPANVMFLVGNYNSMQDFVQTLPRGTGGGCDGAIGTAMTGILAASDWTDDNAPREDTRHGLDTEFFSPRSSYVAYGDRLVLEGTLLHEGTQRKPTTAWSLKTTFRGVAGANGDDACAQWTDLTTEERAACRSCLQSRGWYRLNKPQVMIDHDGFPDDTVPVAQDRWVLSGKVLNKNPPKFVVARRALREVLGKLENVRVGLATLAVEKPTDFPLRYYNPPDIKKAPQPTCDRPAEGPLDESTRNGLLTELNNITFNNAKNALAETLFGLGGFFSSQKKDSKWSGWFNDVACVAIDPTRPEAGGYPGYSPLPYNQKPKGCRDIGTNTFTNTPAVWGAGGTDPSVCWSCQDTAIVVLADNPPFNDNVVPITRILNLLETHGAKHPDGSPLQSPLTRRPGGVNYCDRFTNPASKEACDEDSVEAHYRGPDVGNKHFADDVALFLSHMDLRDDLAGKQSVRTYTVGFRSSAPLLKSVALAGKGRFYPADNGAQLARALQKAVSDVREQSTAFSSSSVAAVQTTGQEASSYVPRFTPHKDRPYEGRLYRFRYFSEFVEGCDTTKAASSAGDALDLDKDGKCDSVFLRDRNNEVVQESADGWVTINPATGQVKGVAAVPFWEANEVLATRSASEPCTWTSPSNLGKGRCIFTVVDKSGDGRFTRADTPLEFTPANAAQLEPYLLGSGHEFCADLFERLNLPWATNDAEEARRRRTACAAKLIEFVRGVDVFDFDGDNDRTENRPCADGTGKSCMLGDIFHSAPVVVEPPIHPIACDLGMHPQCLQTLYADFVQYGNPPVSESICDGSGSSKPCYKATPMDPPLNLRASTDTYGAYGKYMGPGPVGYGKRDRFVLVGANDGMLHAFHAGTALVDPNPANPLVDRYDQGTGQEMWAFIPPDLLPKLRLMLEGHQYMVDGTPMVRDVWVDGGPAGNATSSNGKKEPDEFHTVAILSERGGGTRYVALDVTDPWGMVRASASFLWMWPNALDPESAEVGESWQSFAPKPPPIGPVRLYATNTRGWDETWVALLNGGYSGELTRGRGVYMVDAWTGNTVWSFTQSQMMPVAATPAMLDVGAVNSSRQDSDGFFDTATVGDMGGQVWLLRFDKPGPRDQNGAAMWNGARAFEMAKGESLQKKQPFYSLLANTLQPETGWLRTFGGTGDRNHLLVREEQGCSPSNLLTCAHLSCNANLVVNTNVNGRTTRRSLTMTNGAISQFNVAPSGSASTQCVGARLDMTITSMSCAAGGNTPWGGLSTQSTCEASRDQTSLACTSVDANMNVRSAPQPVTNVPKNRFYGIHTYGGTRRFSNSVEAATFDTRRYTDPEAEGDEARRLTNVTLPDNPGGTASADLKRASPNSPGWLIQYDAADERTAAGAAVLGGIVYWPSLKVSPSPQTCSVAPHTSRSWQADYVTGAPDQAQSYKTATGFLQRKSRQASTPPPEPAAIVSLSKTGEVRYGVSVMEPGQKPVQETLRSKDDVVSDVYWLEVPGALHQCRHVDKNACE